MTITVRVPAKVNVQLAVGAPRPHGDHALANVFLAVGLYDPVP
ncbi:4-(cytidine 5'-diphospho)-2-C-methyl-D-erythritol kinase, partial [Streptomyces sp. PGLac3x]